MASERHRCFNDGVTGRDAPPRHFGDYPHGAYWSADVSQGTEDKKSYEVSGTTIGFMPEDTVTVPLWDEEGLLPEDPSWLNRALDLSPELVADIAAWGEDWNAPNAGRYFTRRQHQERKRRLDTDAKALVERIRSELRPGIAVVLDL